jgi:hypothetical protein
MEFERSTNPWMLHTGTTELQKRSTKTGMELQDHFRRQMILESFAQYRGVATGSTKRLGVFLQFFSFPRAMGLNVVDTEALPHVHPDAFDAKSWSLCEPRNILQRIGSKELFGWFRTLSRRYLAHQYQLLDLQAHELHLRSPML